MHNQNFHFVRLLAEVLRIQKWAAGEAISASRIFGLMHGIESVCRQESESFGISEAVQDKVEDILEEIETGTQKTDGMSIKDRLRADGIDELMRAVSWNCAPSKADSRSPSRPSPMVRELYSLR